MGDGEVEEVWDEAKDMRRRALTARNKGNLDEAEYLEWEASNMLYQARRLNRDHYDVLDSLEGQEH